MLSRDASWHANGCRILHLQPFPEKIKMSAPKDGHFLIQSRNTWVEGGERDRGKVA